MSTPIQDVLAGLIVGRRPEPAALASAFDSIMDGEATPAQIGALLTGLAMAGETPEDVVAATQALRARMTAVPVDTPVIDVCGTGGDGAGTLNISTAVAFVAAGAGLKVAKHGNRAMSSRSGAADVLEALGVRLGLSAEGHRRALEAAGVTFLFAQAHHPAMRHVASARRELGFRTIFNVVGPLSNPAGASRQLLGVYHPRLLDLVAGALVRLGGESAWVVHGEGGLDEISVSGPTAVRTVRGGTVTALEVTPADAGLSLHAPESLQGGAPEDNAAALRAVLSGAPGAYRDAVVLNAAAALVVADKARDLREGAALAAASIDSGAALRALEALIHVSNSEPGA